MVDSSSLGVDLGVSRCCNIALRGSDDGRNLAGVWYTFGALDGGLKMMWSCVSVLEGANVESAFTRSNFLVRLYVAALRRQVRQTNDAASDEAIDGRKEDEMKDVAI